MENGEWRMEDGGWRMEDGGWRMEDGGWRSGSGSPLMEEPYSRVREPNLKLKTGLLLRE
jgi:hypothetical protein